MSAADLRFISYIDGAGPAFDDNAARVLLALIHIERDQGVDAGGPFQARLSQLMEMTQLSRDTVMRGRDLLALGGFIQRADTTPGVGGSLMRIAVEKFDLRQSSRNYYSVNKKQRRGEEGRRGSSGSASGKSYRGKPLSKVEKFDERERRRDLVVRALKMLSLTPTPRTVSKCMEIAAKRMKDGSGADDLLLVVKAEKAAWDGGDRWQVRHNLHYLWSDRQFAFLLGMARDGGWAKSAERRRQVFEREQLSDATLARIRALEEGR